MCKAKTSVLDAVAKTIKCVLQEQGRTQAWAIDRMNEISPDLQMNKSKFSSIIAGKRKIYGDELVVLCRILGITLDEFMIGEKS